MLVGTVINLHPSRTLLGLGREMGPHTHTHVLSLFFPGRVSHTHIVRTRLDLNHRSSLDGPCNSSGHKLAFQATACVFPRSYAEGQGFMQLCVHSTNSTR